jgi:hypothetical protein
MGVASFKSVNRAWLTLAVFSAASLAAALAARPYAGGWNDGSRLATVESLVDHHTLAIDQSVFVNPWGVAPDRPAPYASTDLLSTTFGTGDKLFIDGHFYSDKSPVPALGMAAEYLVLEKVAGIRAADHGDWFCCILTLLTSGVAYALSVTAMFVLFEQLGLSVTLSLIAAASFGMSTMALTYSEHVNNHSLLLGVSALLMLELFQWLRQIDSGQAGLLRLSSIGCLVGAGYAIDLGVGPALIAATGLFVLSQARAIRPLATFAAGMIPWLALHHSVNYLVGGTLAPANANAAYFQWPGCSFNAQNMTGGWHHASIGEFFVYAMGLLFGKRGFIGHNLPLFLAFPAAGSLLRDWRRETSQALYAIAFSLLTWLMYAVNSTNSSGQCCSIRWFLPLLAPGYFVAAVALRDRVSWRPVFFLLSGWGLILTTQMLRPGPWTQRMIPYYWQIQGAAAGSLLAWAAVHCHRTREVNLAKNSSLALEGKAA